MKTLFFSDLHLDDSRPEAFDWLQSLLEGPARSADAVYVLGDLFEYWIGDDAVSPLAARFADLAAALQEAVAGIGHCKQCRMFTEHDLCSICAASGRDETQLCIVESPADVMALEDATGFRGLYFVLMGHLSPLDGIGPEELGLGRLDDLFAFIAQQEELDPFVHGGAVGGDVRHLVDQQDRRHPDADRDGE